MDDSCIQMREGQRFVANAYKNLGICTVLRYEGEGGMSMNITCKYCTFCGNWTNDYLCTGDQKPIRCNRSGIYFWSPVKKKKSILKAHSHQIFLRYFSIFLALYYDRTTQSLIIIKLLLFYLSFFIGNGIVDNKQ